MFADSPTPIGYGTRIIRGIFPLECWPSSSDCPFPTINNTNYDFHRQLSINTFFVSNEDYCHQQDGDYVVNTLAPQFQFWTLPGSMVDISHNQYLKT